MAPSIRVIRASDYKRSVWKNGLGHTDEIAIYPEGSELKTGNFLWRLSSARIEKASPFSTFPRHDRTLVVLEGAGLHLSHQFEGEEDSIRLLPLTPYEFPGDVPSHCELVDGHIRDLSVFVRKAEAESVTEVVSSNDYAWMPAGRWNFAYALDDFRVVVNSETIQLSRGETLRVDLTAPLSEEEALRFESEGEGTLVLVAIQA